jgi:hypothetical protein
VWEDVYFIHFIPNVSCASRIERYWKAIEYQLG